MRFIYSYNYFHFPVVTEVQIIHAEQIPSYRNSHHFIKKRTDTVGD